MKALIVLALFLGYFSGFAQSVPKLHVIFAVKHDGLEIDRLNMENDTLITQTMRIVQEHLKCPMQIHRLSNTHFTSKALQDTIAGIKATSNDIIVLYYAGYGIKSASDFPNWQLDNVAIAGMPVGQAESWLKAKKVHLGLIIADCSAKQTTNGKPGSIPKKTNPFSAISTNAMPPDTGVLNDSANQITTATVGVDLSRQIMHQLFLRPCGIVKMSGAIPSALPTQSIYFTASYAGSVFTQALQNALLNLLTEKDPANLPNISFQTLADETAYFTTKLGGSQQAPVLEINPCTGAPNVRSNSVTGQVNQRRSTGGKWQGLTINKANYEGLLQKSPIRASYPLPARIDLSRYAPPVLDQGEKGICVAVSIGYYMRSILEARKQGITDKQQILKQSFSPFYLYNRVKTPTDDDCTLGIDAGQALEYIKQNGLPQFSAFPDPNLCQVTRSVPTAASSKIMDYVKLFSITDAKKDKVLAVKQTLAELSPVVVGIETTGSIDNLSFGKTWVSRLKTFVQELATTSTRPPSTPGWHPEQANSLDFGHALCVVGYDDTMFGTGAFKLINSWGSSWGSDGYFWISYENFGCYTKYAYQAYLHPTAEDNNLLDTDLTISQGSFLNNALPFTVASSNPKLLAYTLTQSQQAGASFKFKVDVKKQTYLYLITASESDSAVTRLLPLPGYKMIIAPGNRLIYPGNNTVLTLSKNPGQEYWLFLFSASPIQIDRYIQTMNTLKGSFPDRVTTAFEGQLVSNRSIHYKPKKMGFYLQNDPDVRERVVPLLVTMNHAP